MANLGFVSTFNINGNELTLKDAVLTEVVNEIIEAIGANNGDISERINNLHERSFDALIKISSQNESEITNIQDGMYKLQYVTVTGEGNNATETLNNSAILIQKGTNQYLYKDGNISNRTKTGSTWGSWITFEGGVTSVNGQTGAVNITIPSKTSDLTNDSNFTSNTGTITGITMNGVSKGTSGVINLGTVLTEHQNISGKVDKVTGMGLSSNDYTTEEKTKLAGINIGDLSNLTTTELNSIFATT